jgi:hypothetical protein
MQARRDHYGRDAFAHTHQALERHSAVPNDSWQHGFSDCQSRSAALGTQNAEHGTQPRLSPVTRPMTGRAATASAEMRSEATDAILRLTRSMNIANNPREHCGNCRSSSEEPRLEETARDRQHEQRNEWQSEL